MLQTTHDLRKKIEVLGTSESDTHIGIYYRCGEQYKHLMVDRKLHTELMQFVDGPVCQWDAINIAVEHERNVQMQVVTIDMGILNNQEQQLN